jgi:hypothetical protein
MLRLMFSAIPSLCFILWGEPKAVQSFIDWNLHNAPFVLFLCLYPYIERGYRILRFLLFA